MQAKLWIADIQGVISWKNPNSVLLPTFLDVDGGLQMFSRCSPSAVYPVYFTLNLSKLFIDVLRSRAKVGNLGLLQTYLFIGHFSNTDALLMENG